MSKKLNYGENFMSDIIEKIKQQRKGAMFIIEAPSGTGKSVVIKELLRQDTNLKFSVSVTTRAKREGEIDGLDYHYINDAQYDEFLAQDAFYEYVNSQYGNRYGTLRSEVDSFINVGKDVVFDVDWEGMRQIKEKAPNEVVSIYLLPPSIKELRRRLESRGTDSKEVIEKRMALIVDKLKHWNEFDYAIVNVDVDETVTKIQKIISCERMKRVRQVGIKVFVDALMKQAEEA